MMGLKSEPGIIPSAISDVFDYIEEVGKITCPTPCNSDLSHSFLVQQSITA